MNTMWIVLIAAVVIYSAYNFYAKRIDRNVIQADAKKATPAKMYMDGVDFMPTSRNVLYGYHFKSIAAAGPIVGVITAANLWGWLPSLLWLMVGVSFIGWVSDYSAIVVAVRNDGNSMSAVSHRLIAPRTRTILFTFIFFYLLLIAGAFLGIMAALLAARADVPLGIIALGVMGFLAGQMLYKWKMDLILVTAITPTKAGIGKTTVSIGLALGLNQIGKRAIVALREPSLGPCFGQKGGAAGGGYAQVLPMESINLHFTGDFHAITSANNMISALLDNYLYQNRGTCKGLKEILWKRVLDINDRSLRSVVTGLNGKANGIPTETGFDITPASEIMAILCLSTSIEDLERRIELRAAPGRLLEDVRPFLEVVLALVAGPLHHLLGGVILAPLRLSRGLNPDRVGLSCCHDRSSGPMPRDKESHCPAEKNTHRRPLAYSFSPIW